MRRALAAALLATSIACATTGSARSAVPTTSATSAAGPDAAPRGTLLIVGGGEQPRALVEHFVALAGGPGRARIAVLPMASEEADEGGREKVAQLDSLGARSFVLNVTREQADMDSVVALVDSVTGIWFGGGDQLRLAAALRGSKLARALHARYTAGAVVGGTSAGAAIMSDSMITGNQTPPGDTSGYYGDEFPRVARRYIDIQPGLGFLPSVIIDMHFIRRERANRLLSAVLEHPSLIGIGIDEGTALEVDPDGTWHIRGRSAALLYDARDARITTSSAPLLGATGIHLLLLPSGSEYDPRTGRAVLPRS